jgi:hypothetical protein
MITVEVTQEDIDNGKRGRCFSCPVALAIQRAINKIYGISSGSVTSLHIMYCNSHNDLVVLETPEYVRQAIKWFDRTGQMKPFTFTLEEDSDG